MNRRCRNFSIFFRTVLVLFAGFFIPTHGIGEEQFNPPDYHKTLEDLARNEGYAGGRLKKNKEPGRDPELLDIRGDKEFRNDLKAKGYNFKDTINDLKTGFQATVIEATEGPLKGKNIIIFRGTEPDQGLKELGKDLWPDLDRTVGRTQYEPNKAKLDEWAEKYPGAIVTGHSLGAALSQQFIADHPSQVKEAVLFAAPGVGDEIVEKFNNANTPTRPALTLYQGKGDLLTYGGDAHLPSQVIMASGKKIEKDPHSTTMLQGGVKLQGIGYKDYQDHRTEHDYLLSKASPPDRVPPDKDGKDLWTTKEGTTTTTEEVAEGIKKYEKDHADPRLPKLIHPSAPLPTAPAADDQSLKSLSGTWQVRNLRSGSSSTVTLKVEGTAATAQGRFKFSGTVKNDEMILTRSIKRVDEMGSIGDVPSPVLQAVLAKNPKAEHRLRVISPTKMKGTLVTPAFQWNTETEKLTKYNPEDKDEVEWEKTSPSTEAQGASSGGGNPPADFSGTWQVRNLRSGSSSIVTLKVEGTAATAQGRFKFSGTVKNDEMILTRSIKRVDEMGSIGDVPSPVLQAVLAKNPKAEHRLRVISPTKMKGTLVTPWFEWNKETGKLTRYNPEDKDEVEWEKTSPSTGGK